MPHFGGFRSARPCSGMRFRVVFRAPKQSADFGRFRCSSRELLRLRRFPFEIFAFPAGLLNGRFCFMPNFGCSCRCRSVFGRFRMRTHHRHGFGPFLVLYSATFRVPVTLPFENCPFLTAFWNGRLGFTPLSGWFSQCVLWMCHSGAFSARIFGVFGFLPGNFCVPVLFAFGVSPFLAVFWIGRLRYRLYGGGRRR